MLGIKLSGKRAFVAGIADDGGFGFAIAKQLAEAGAEITVGTWPPAYGLFTKLLDRGRMKESTFHKKNARTKWIIFIPDYINFIIRYNHIGISRQP